MKATARLTFAAMILLSSAAHAQGHHAPSVALGKHTAQDPEQPAAAAPAVNPMTGRTLGYEQRLRSFEEAQVDAKIAEEQLREKRARAELARVERDARAQTGVAPLSGPEARFINETGRPPRPSQPPVPGKVTVEAAPAAAPLPMPMAPPPRMDPPRVAGVLRAGGELVALMEYDGRVTQVREGDTWQGKRVDAVTEDQVVLGGSKLRYQPQDARFVLSDPDLKAGAAPRPPGVEAGPFAAPRTPAGQPFNPSLNRAIEGQTVPRAIDLPQQLR